MAEKDETELTPANTKMVWIQGGLYTMVAVLTPVASALANDTPFTTRFVAATVISAIISGGIALKAFLSNSNKI